MLFLVTQVLFSSNSVRRSQGNVITRWFLCDGSKKARSLMLCIPQGCLKSQVGLDVFTP